MTKAGKIQESRQNQVHTTHSSSVRTNQQTRGTHKASVTLPETTAKHRRERDAG